MASNALKFTLDVVKIMPCSPKFITLIKEQNFPLKRAQNRSDALEKAQKKGSSRAWWLASRTWWLASRAWWLASHAWWLASHAQCNFYGTITRMILHDCACDFSPNCTLLLPFSPKILLSLISSHLAMFSPFFDLSSSFWLIFHLRFHWIHCRYS